MEASVLTTRGSRLGLGARVSLKELQSSVVLNPSVRSLLGTPEAQASLKKLRQHKRKEQKEMLQRQEEQRSRLELSRAKSAQSDDAENENTLRSRLSQESGRNSIHSTFIRRAPSIKASRSEVTLGASASRRQSQDGLSGRQISNESGML